MEGGRHPIFDAAYKSNLELVKTLTERDASLVHIIDPAQWTPLLYAAFGGHMPVVRYLLERGADLRNEDKNGRTALHIAARAGHADLVKLVLEKGAAVNAADDKGRIALMDAATYGQDAVVLMLLEHRADIEAADMEGETAMHHACYERDGVLKLLLEVGGDPSRRNDRRATPLGIAKANKDPTCFRILQGWNATFTLSKARRLREVALSSTADAVAAGTQGSGSTRDKTHCTCFAFGAVTCMASRGAVAWTRRHAGERRLV